MTTSFAASVADWVHEVEGANEAIWRESVQELAHELDVTVPQGGNVPIDTGFLRASLMASTAMMPVIEATSRPPSSAGPGSYGPSAGQVEAVIAGADLGETIYLGYTAAYALRQNYGFTGADPLGRHHSPSGHLFVERAAQKWPTIVDRVSQRLSAKLAFS